MKLVSRFTPILPALVLMYVLLLNLAFTQQAHAFIVRTKWAVNNVSYRPASFVVGGVTAPFPANVVALVDNAAAKWSKPQTGKNFSLIKFLQSGPVPVAVDRASFAANGWPANPGITFVNAPNGFNQTATTYLNSNYAWNNTCVMNQAQKQVDTLTVILHELGHVVTLDHDGLQPGAVMWPNWVCKQALQADDKNGIGALYP